MQLSSWPPQTSSVCYLQSCPLKTQPCTVFLEKLQDPFSVLWSFCCYWHKVGHQLANIWSPQGCFHSKELSSWVGVLKWQIFSPKPKQNLFEAWWSCVFEHDGALESSCLVTAMLLYITVVKTVVVINPHKLGPNLFIFLHVIKCWGVVCLCKSFSYRRMTTPVRFGVGTSGRSSRSAPHSQWSLQLSDRRMAAVHWWSNGHPQNWDYLWMERLNTWQNNKTI